MARTLQPTRNRPRTSPVEAREAQAAYRSACARAAVAARDAEALAADYARGLWRVGEHHTDLMRMACADLADAGRRIAAALAAVGGADDG